MIIKLLGGGLVFVSSVLLGIYYSMKEGFRAADLTDLKKAFLQLKSEIEFSHSFLADAMDAASKRLPRRLAVFFDNVATGLRESVGETGDIWRDVVREKLSATYLEVEDLDNLARLGESLASPNKSLQSEGIDMAVRYIDDKTAELRETSRKSRKLYGSVGVIGGILIIVVLL